MATEAQVGDHVLYVTSGREGIVADVAGECALVDFGGVERYWCLYRALRTIPLAATQGRPSGYEESPEANVQFRSVRALVVDDHHDTADAFVDLLDVSGHKAKALYSADSLIETTVAFKPDVVFLDLMMPGIGGYQAARRFRNDPKSTGVWLVAISGFVNSNSIAIVREAGYDAYYLKPIEIRALEEILVRSSLPRSSNPGFLLGPRLMQSLYGRDDQASQETAPR